MPDIAKFGPPPTTSDRIRAMKPKTDEYFETDKPQSVMAMCSRFSVTSTRRYKTRKEAGGVRVWRMK